MSFIRDEDPVIIISSILLIVAAVCFMLLVGGRGIQQLILSGFSFIQ